MITGLLVIIAIVIGLAVTGAAGFFFFIDMERNEQRQDH